MMEDDLECYGHVYPLSCKTISAKDMTKPQQPYPKLHQTGKGLVVDICLCIWVSEIVFKRLKKLQMCVCEKPCIRVGGVSIIH